MSTKSTSPEKAYKDLGELRTHERELLYSYISAKRNEKAAKAEIEYLAPQVTILLTQIGDVRSADGARLSAEAGPGSTLYSAAVADLEQQLAALKEKEVADGTAKKIPSGTKIVKLRDNQANGGETDAPEATS